MKKIITVLIFIPFILILLSGCTKTNPIDNTITAKETKIGYKVEKIVLSKGYQSLEPNVEILKKDDETNIFISLGLVECSGVTVDKITKSNNEINIYIDRLLENNKSELSVPQLLISLDEPEILNLENLKINIINQNYKPIELKFTKSQILNNIYAKFKIAPNTVPNANLIRTNGKLIWNIGFNNMFDKDDKNASLINFNVKADANTGEIISFEKFNISDYIDDGVLLDHATQSYLIYKQKHTEKELEYETLYLYNINTHKKNKLYTTNDTIFCAKFSPDYKNVALIENRDDSTNIYLISIDDKATHKITPLGFNRIWNVKWQDNKNLYFLDYNTDENKSTLFHYNLKENDAEPEFVVFKNISDFDVGKYFFVLTEYNEDLSKQKIYLKTTDEDLQEIDTGYNGKIIDNNNIVYMTNFDNNNESILKFYDIENNSTHLESEMDVKSYSIKDDNKLIIIIKNSCNNDYTLAQYNLNNKELKNIAKVTGDKIFYDEKDNIGYISLIPPIDNKSERSIIYSIDFNKIN